MWQRLADNISAHLAHPRGGPIGWYVKYALKKFNKSLSLSAVDLCEIQPHHHVLEVGFGTGAGLKYACQKVQDGPGKIYGVDRSEKMFSETAEALFTEIHSRKLELLLSQVERLPFNDNKFDRVYHVNCYYFWHDVIDGAAELYRVMKPNSMMVTTLNLDRIKQVKKRGILTKNANTDVMHYMWCLETVGFQDVSMRYLKNKLGLEHQAVFAYIHDKPKLDDLNDSAVSGSSDR